MNIAELAESLILRECSDQITPTSCASHIETTHGFSVTGFSHVVSVDDFNLETGIEIAKDNARGELISALSLAVKHGWINLDG